MYTKRIFSPRDLLIWTRRELVLLLGIAVVPVVLYDVLDQRWIYLPWLPIALVGTAVAFILSFQNNAAYDRTWEARKIWGGIVNSSRAWAMMVNDFISNRVATEPATDAELRKIRQRLVRRHVAWMTSLRHALRASRPWEHVNQEKTNREWAARIQIREHHVSLAEDIADSVEPGEGPAVCGRANPAAQILALQSRDLAGLRERGLIDDFRHVRMQDVLNELVYGQGKSERIKNFPYPRQYATLNLTLLWIFIVLIPFGLVREFAELGEEIASVAPALSQRFVWLSVPFSLVVMWVFHTIERIGRTTENPFEGSVNDVPISTMSRAIEIDLRQMIGDDPASIPAPLEPKHSTQS
ncbi:MAG: bestrophin family ion channel [Planctomycetota bacterium]